ncbi:TadE/TadG family type IV pilus assembly protein [Hypericibacter sp.]|uniref:TadE/TadG family type IV pilus assembly protein n=1 Tax=Hypericibacter sp. TaxID=2705401 RepID=UPI003D6D51BC
MRKRLLPLIYRFVRDRRGTVLMELAFGLPILVMILLGCFEAARFVLLDQKLARVAATTADLVAQSEGISEAQITDLFSAADDSALPFDLAGTGRVIISSVAKPTAADPTVAWQRISSGTVAVTSALGTAGQIAALPAGLTLRQGDNVIVAEVFYNYVPVFLGATKITSASLYQVSYNRPRIINLTQVTP